MMQKQVPYLRVTAQDVADEPAKLLTRQVNQSGGGSSSR